MPAGETGCFLGVTHRRSDNDCGQPSDATKVVDTVQQQTARYETSDGECVELQPGLLKHLLRKPDLIATCSKDYTVRTFDVKNGFKPVQIFEAHLRPVNAVCPYRGDKLLSASNDGTVRLWQTGVAEYGELLMTYWLSDQPIMCVCAIPGQRGACGGFDRYLRIFSVVTGAVLHRCDDHAKAGPDGNYFQIHGLGAIYCVMHLHGNVAVSGSDDATLRFWDVDEGKCLSMHVGHTGLGQECGERGGKLSQSVAAVWKITHVGRNRIASCSYDRSVCLWNTAELENIRVIRKWIASENSVVSLGIVGDDLLATGGSDKELKVWNLQTGDCVHTLKTRSWTGGVAHIDDDVFAIGGMDSTLKVYNWKTGQDTICENCRFVHDYSILGLISLSPGDASNASWTQEAILYSSAPKEVGEVDGRKAMDAIEAAVKTALSYTDD